MIPLFARYPSLQEALPFVSLGQYPTPILDAPGLDPGGRCAAIAVKHDGVSGTLYGGNKVRKLEFLLADALHRGHTEVLTFGGALSTSQLLSIPGVFLGLFLWFRRVGSGAPPERPRAGAA